MLCEYLPQEFPLWGTIKGYCIVLLYCTVLYCTVLYCTVLYCTVLYCTVLYCTVLYCTVLYYDGQITTRLSRVVQITLPPSISSTRVNATNPTHPDQVTSSSVALPHQIPTTALVTHTQHHQAFPLTTAITTATTTTNTPQMRLPTPTPTIQLSQLQTHDSLSLAAHMSQTLPSLGSIATTTLGPPATTAGVQVTNCNVSLAAAVAGVTANINQLLPSKYRSTRNNCITVFQGFPGVISEVYKS